ncbi:MAG: phosphate acyltransferase [Planctomycetota bacterium]
MIKRVEEILALVTERALKPRLAVAGAGNASVLEVVAAARQRGVADSVLFGDGEKIQAAAEGLSLDISSMAVRHCATDADSVQASLAAIHDGQADILCKGVAPTWSVLKGVLDKRFNFRTDRALSHVGVFNVPGEDRVLIITDAGVNVQPDLSRKRDITLNAVDLAHVLGFDRPRVAILSFIEKVTDAKISSQADAAELTRMYQNGTINGCVVAGPYSLDVALSPEAAAIKGVEGEVAGRADIVVMHDLGMGNVLYKALLLWCKPVIAAAVLGARVPIVCPSRADSLETKLNSIALAALVLGPMAGGRK